MFQYDVIKFFESGTKTVADSCQTLVEGIRTSGNRKEEWNKKPSEAHSETKELNELEKTTIVNNFWKVFLQLKREAIKKT